jgi:hypothetical protein
MAQKEQLNLELEPSLSDLLTQNLPQWLMLNAEP